MPNEIVLKDTIHNLEQVMHDYLKFQIDEFDKKLKLISSNKDLNLNVLHDRDMPWEDINKQILKDHKFLLDQQNQEKFERSLDKFVVSCSRAKEALKTLDFVKAGVSK
jgi:hypothetical protein